MKRAIVILIATLLFMASCKDEPETVKKWTGLRFLPSRLRPPVCVVWYKPNRLGWETYKCFAQADEIKTVIKLLEESDSEICDEYFIGTDKLSLFFYKGKPETLEIREVSFKLKNNTFIWPFGESEALGKFILEKEEWGRYFMDPYDPNLIKRAKESQERLRKLAEQLKAQKEAEDQEKAEEPNQPEP